MWTKYKETVCWMLDLFFLFYSKYIIVLAACPNTVVVFLSIKS